MTTLSELKQIPAEVWELLEAVCEQRLADGQTARLEQLVLSDPAVRRLYVDYVSLHGSLHWDASMPADILSASDGPAILEPSVENESSEKPPVSARRPLTNRLLVASVAVCLFFVGVLAQKHFFQSDSPGSDPQANPELSNRSRPGKTSNPTEKRPAKSRRPIKLGPATKVVDKQPDSKKRLAVDRKPVVDPPFVVPAGGSSVESVVAYLDTRLAHHWHLDGVDPSKAATDAEWIRRAFLDLIGRIPTVAEVQRFVKNGDAKKRTKLIDRLLDEPRYARHIATVWGNLLVGRRPRSDVNRPGLEKFLRNSFARNRSWNRIVVDLVSAEGSVEDNGAANFLVAHLNNQAVPATAVTARLFLGLQVQCTQCHNHPTNYWKQNQFWELNAFFKQTQAVRKRSPSGRRVATLVNKNTGGPTYYQTRNHLVRVAFPKYGRTKIDPQQSVNRRAELARLMFTGDDQQVARAFVNRTWAQFFGYGFTRPIDDMGPHNPPTHPELLDRLTEEFVASGYDVKKLIRWICNSRAYRLSSRFNETNREDAPDKGYHPQFSRMYVKSMSPEQLYDSLLVATKADRSVKGDWEQVARQRQLWLKQFFQAHQTEENDESTTFDGTIPQALMMMNSPLVDEAIGGKPGTYLHDVLNASGSDLAKARKLCIAALSRQPTEKELAALRKLLRRSIRRQTHQQVLQDLFWAYLNSNEFVLIP